MRIINICFIILFGVVLLWADTPDILKKTTDKNKELFITADYACYKYSDNTEVVFTELYYSFFRNQLYFRPDSSGYEALINVVIEIKSEAGELIDSSSWRMGNRVDALAEAKIPNYLINDIITAQLVPGNYTCIITASDDYSDVFGQKAIEITVPSFSDEKLELSPLELLFSVLEADGGNFDKAGKKLIPNTKGVYSHDNSIVYFYAEAYNLNPDWNTYTVDIRIYDGNGNIYKDIPPVTEPVSANSAVILNGFNIASFKAGMYRLEIGVHSGGNSVTAKKYFEVTPGKVEWQMAMERQELADFPEAEAIITKQEAKNFRNQILYLATREELRQYDDLPIEGKNNFARAFWARRDPTPGTAINEYKLEHYSLVRYANEAFSTFKSAGTPANGWRADRGRVYIVYGVPSDEENYPSSLEAKPWIKWNYDSVEGGVYFIFIDETGFGDYRLVHSSAQGEPKDYNWEDRLLPATIIRSYDGSFNE